MKDYSFEYQGNFFSRGYCFKLFEFNKKKGAYVFRKKIFVKTKKYPKDEEIIEAYLDNESYIDC